MSSNPKTALLSPSKFESLLRRRSQIDTGVARNIIEMLDDGKTVPFIARYRKEKIKNMAPEHLHLVKEEYNCLKQLGEKMEKVANRYKSVNSYTREVEMSLQRCTAIEDVEMLEEPLKNTGPRSYANRAKELGLEPLAEHLLNHPEDNSVPIPEAALKSLHSVKEVEQSVGHILADRFSKDVDILREIKSHTKSNSPTILTKFRSILKDVATDEKEKYGNYDNFQRPIKHLESFHVLAINRGEKKKILTVKLKILSSTREKFYEMIWKKYKALRNSSSRHTYIQDVLKDSWKRLVKPSLRRHIRAKLTKIGHQEALTYFSSNLRQMLMIEPVRNQLVLGIDPGYDRGCKFALVGPAGAIITTGVFHLKFKPEHTRQQLLDIFETWKVRLLALGSGQGSRPFEQFLTKLAKSKDCLHKYDFRYAIVNECGASVYSASSFATRELKDIDVILRGAVSIARRLQDPLCELSKIDPKHLGVGMYQHDLSEKSLRTISSDIMEECISFVGVDLNYAPEHVLQYVSGLNGSRSRAIVEYRESLQGQRFTSRQQLLEIRGLGPKTFELCAGFVRIFPPPESTECSSGSGSGSSNVSRDLDGDVIMKDPTVAGRKRRQEAPSKKSKRMKLERSGECNLLDQTAIHPESYALTGRILSIMGFELSDLGKLNLLQKCQNVLTNERDYLEQFLMGEYGIETVEDIFKALSQPIGYDIRQDKFKPLFKSGIMDLDSLSCGMPVSGVVTNVTGFGVFCDIGINQDAFIYKTKIPSCGLKVGFRISARVESVNVKKKRIALYAVDCQS